MRDATAMEARWHVTWADQERFAALSGDRNPAHLEPLVARRRQAGAPVVYGIRTLLWALEELAKASPPPSALRSLRVRFAKPVFVGDVLTLRVAPAGETELRAELVVDGLTTATLRLAFGPASEVPEGVAQAPAVAHAFPSAPSFPEIASWAGSVDAAAPAEAFAETFPSAARWLSARRLRGLAAISRLVGMECPGLHSVLTALTLDLTTGDSEAIVGRTVAADARFRHVRVAVTGAGLSGQVESFATLPTAPVPIADLAARVDPAEFAGTTALIVGGSRGLGAVVAKLIAVGGGHPIVTYARGEAEASALAGEIRAAGGRCTVARYDALEPAEPQLDALGVPFEALYYFATGHIFRRKTRVFEPEAFRGFLSLYVEGFAAVCAAAAARGPVTAFYPSTVALDDRAASRELTEYAMAKAAGEILCADLAAATPGLTITLERLPRILTDQTNSMVPVPSADPVEVLLPIVRRIQVQVRRR